MQHAETETITRIADDAEDFGVLAILRRTPLSRPADDRVKAVTDRVRDLDRQPAAVDTAKFNSGI